MRPVRPLKNYLWNDTTFAELNQFCFGTTKSCIDKDSSPLVNDVRLYVKDKESGDYGVLEEEVAYYDSDITETVFTHIKRGMDFLYGNQGVHGLGLWRGGDIVVRCFHGCNGKPNALALPL